MDSTNIYVLISKLTQNISFFGFHIINPYFVKIATYFKAQSILNYLALKQTILIIGYIQIMSFPEHLEISIDTVFSLFSHHDGQILTQVDIIQLLGFVFTQLGITRPVDQTDLHCFLQEHQLQNEIEIAKEHFGDQKFLNFNRRNGQNLVKSELLELKIPVQPFVQELRSIGCQFIERHKIRQFLIGINTLLQIPKPVQDEDVQKFISDFDQNDDGQLETKDLQGIQSLKFRVRKCRRYA